MNLGDYNKHRGWQIPEDEDPVRKGYLVNYLPDDYESWSPKEIFEAAYFPMTDSDGSTVSQEMVDQFIGNVFAQQLDEKTTLVSAETLTGFRQHEVSSCVDPKNYDHVIGIGIATERIKNTLWECLGFVVQWGRFGLKREG